MLGAQSFMGTPGKPAPEPRSARRASAFGLRLSATSKSFTTGDTEKTQGKTGRGGWRRKGFAEVAGYYFFFVADCGQVDAGVPVEEYIDVRRYTLELGGGEDSRFLSGFRRFGMTRSWGGDRKGWSSSAMRAGCMGKFDCRRLVTRYR